jgi:hypothetical protein
MKSLFRFGRWLDVSEKVKIVLVKIGAFLFGSWRWTVIEENGKKIYHSMMNSNFSEKAEVYLPSILHEKIQKSVLDGRVYFGNFFANQTKVPKQTVEEN